MDALFAALFAALVGFVVATGTGVRRLVDAWFRRRERSMLRDGYAAGLRNLAEFSRVIERLTKIEKVDRVLVFTGQNGGGLPEAGRPYTVRSTFGWSGRGDAATLKDYEFDVLVDHHYTDMLLKLVDGGSVVNTTAEMPDGAILKAFYKDEGVVQSLVYFLHCDSSQLVYISVSSYTGTFSNDQRVLIEMQVQRLRAILARAG